MSDETKGVDWDRIDQLVEAAAAVRWIDGVHPNRTERELYIALERAYPAIRAEMRAKDDRIKRLESEATLLRIDMGNMTELRAAITAIYNAAMWLASDETGREVPEWVYEAIDAAQKLGATK